MPSSPSLESRVIVSGVHEFELATQAVKDRFREAARRIVSLGALILTDSMKEQYRARPGGSRRVSSSGRVYYSGSGAFAARPPNPTIRTGHTINSIRPKKIVAVDPDTWMSQTGPTVDYEVFPELGTRFIRVPFPAVKMGLENANDRLIALAEREWEEAAMEIRA